mgnify:CR=1 FL=1
MVLLKAMEFAVGAFLTVFVLWQIVAPLLMGSKPFPMFRERTKRKKG